MIKIYIGPNGYGKTTKLEEIYENTCGKENSIFLQSEILLSDEIKDSKDETKTMEYILNELIETNIIKKRKERLEKSIDEEVQRNVDYMNNIIDSIIKYNGQIRTKDFISKSNKKIYKGLVKINNKEVLEKMGSGQKMQFLLELVRKSSKKYIFLDEPEKYSHPSLLNVTARLINELDSKGKEIYIATHSPKLISMLNVKLEDIHIINDISHNDKKIDFQKTVDDLSKRIPINNLCEKEKTYYDINYCSENIYKTCHRDFLEALFSKKVYLCEGINDKLFLKKYLRDNNEYFDEYHILSVYGKDVMPIFIHILKQLDIEVISIFDRDDENVIKHKCINEYIINESNKSYGFVSTLEKELGFLKNKTNYIAFYSFLENIKLDKNKYNI